MHLVEVDVVRGEAAQAGFEFETQAGSGRVGEDAALVPVEAGLGGNEEIFAAAVGADGSADNLLRMAVSIDGGGVDEVDAALEGAEAGGDGHLVGHRAPIQPANGPGAEADPGNLHTGNGCCLHAQYLIGNREQGIENRTPIYRCFNPSVCG